MAERAVRVDAKRARDDSSSSSSGSSDSSSEEAAARKRKQHRADKDKDRGERKEKKKSGKDKRRGSSSKKDKKHRKRSDKERKEKRRKSDKAERRDEAQPRTGNLMSSWGKYGIVRDDQPDGSRYEHEFQAWMSDVKGLGAAGVARWELDEYWKTFCEDFNTGTLPGKKYYDLRKWTAEQARDGPSRRQERTSFDDEEEMRRERAEGARRREQQVTKETLVRMGATNAIENMRAQEIAKQQMVHAWKTGDVGKAEEMLKKFQPETVEEKWARLKKEARALG